MWRMNFWEAEKEEENSYPCQKYKGQQTINSNCLSLVTSILLHLLSLSGGEAEKKDAKES